MKSPSFPSSYQVLLTTVKRTLLEGQRRVEQERVRTYWETGRVINTHILKNKGRADYGSEVVKRLAEDLNVNLSVLQRCVQFAKAYPQLPIVARGRQFSWSHYRKLITVSDDRKRSTLEKTAAQKGWTAQELAVRIRETKPSVSPDGSADSARRAAIPVLTAPKRGSFYTYTVFTPDEVFAVTGEAMADCGFDVWRQVRIKDWPQAKFQKASDYTYRARVEKVIDGDTLWVHIDLGLSAFTRQKLRLRGIDCPELSTAAGQKARAFVQKMLKGVETITIVTSKSDKYDRYLADVWVGEEYLNQRLLDEGLAGVWEG